MIEIIHFHRKPALGQVSIERLFRQLRNTLGPSVKVSKFMVPHSEVSVWGLLSNLWASRQAAQGGQLCHITGHVYYLALVLPRRRLILTIHDCGRLTELTGWKHKVVRWFWFGIPMRRASVITAISQTTKADLQAIVPPGIAEKITVIPNCVADEFTYVPKAFNRECPTILQVGTGKNKNVQQVIAAVTGIRCRLEIVGPVSEALKLKYESQLADCRVLGELSDEELLEAYRACDMVVFASRREGFGIPILEAQATGRPLVTSNRSSMPEVAGNGAVFVDPEDSASIRNKILELIEDEDLRQRLVQNGLENVKRYRPEKVAAQYQALYEHMDNRLANP